MNMFQFLCVGAYWMLANPSQV